MKLFTISALSALILLSIIVLSGCTPPIISTPTPFTTGEEVQPVQGCLMLREEVEKYNAKHPQSPKKADC